ncbi:MAG: cytochrome C [Deltaproteobacteria bacterium]|nr:cytochrome C [Candidatus Deferrimicrobium borealis]
MMRRAYAVNILGAALLALLFGCSSATQTPSVPPKHPEDLPAGRVDCLECHKDVSTGALKPYANFRHSGVFIRSHGTYARQGQNLCSSCHKPEFCQTCHAGKEELKPDTKMGDRPDRMAPHRGDYLVTHRIDGRLDPGSCYRCHGNKSDSRCKQCHK